MRILVRIKVNDNILLSIIKKKRSAEIRKMISERFESNLSGRSFTIYFEIIAENVNRR